MSTNPDNFQVELDKNIKLLDSPGVVLSENVGPLATIQNAVKLDNLEDPVKPIEIIMEHCGVAQLAEHYQIDPFTTAHELTALLAFSFGKLVSGGVPDTTAAARLLLKDWSNGSVQFYIKPPLVSQNLGQYFRAKFADIMIPHIWRHFGDILGTLSPWEFHGNWRGITYY